MNGDGPRGPGRPRRATASRVAAAGLRLIREVGFEATSVADIAAAAGIGRSTFFRYFSSKDEIFWHCAADQARSVRSWLDAARPDDDPFDVVVEAVVDATRDVTTEESGATLDLLSIVEERPELDSRRQAWMRQRTAVIHEYMIRRRGHDRDTLSTAYAHAISAGVTAAGHVFARDGGNLSDLVEACVRPIHDGFAAASP